MGRRGGFIALVALAAIAAGSAVAWLMLANDIRQPSSADVALVLAIGWSFVASGLVAWRLRPNNPIGAVMVLTGFLRFAAALDWSQDPAVFTVGHALLAAYFGGIAYILLTFPGGRLGSLVERWLFGAVVVVVGPLHVAWLLFGGHHQKGFCAGCPKSVIELANNEPIARTFEVSHEVIAVLAGVLAIGVLVHRWRHASAALRFAIAPVIWVGAAAWAVLLFWVVGLLLEEPLGRAPEMAMELMLALVAVAFLVGVARTRLARSAVADLVIELGGTTPAGDLRVALARTLRDPSLKIAFWLPDAGHYVDAQGGPVALPDEGDGRSVTVVQRDGRRIAALVHDPAVGEDPRLVDSACAAAALALENERLQAELRARLKELAASRTRLVEAAQAERRRIERDLHDGTQQRLVSIAMTLGLADAKLSTDPPAARTLVTEARTCLATALDELRELSRGIHPGILTERGLPAALDEIACRARIPVQLDVSVAGRLPEPVETAGYYVVAEALSNVVKHAAAATVEVRVQRFNGRAMIQVRDDGTGGAEVGRGSGLGGLRDRVEALGGRFTVASSAGQGTTVTAEIPCG